jgi:Utp11 protein
VRAAASPALDNSLTDLLSRCRSERKRLGLLEKHKDYKLRAKDYHRKEDAIKARLRSARARAASSHPSTQVLRNKAALRNPDEFYFAMEKARTKDGVHLARCEPCRPAAVPPLTPGALFQLHSAEDALRRRNAFDEGAPRHRPGFLPHRSPAPPDAGLRLRAAEGAGGGEGASAPLHAFVWCLPLSLIRIAESGAARGSAAQR